MEIKMFLGKITQTCELRGAGQTFGSEARFSHSQWRIDLRPPAWTDYRHSHWPKQAQPACPPITHGTGVGVVVLLDQAAHGAPVALVLLIRCRQVALRPRVTAPGYRNIALMFVPPRALHHLSSVASHWRHARLLGSCIYSKLSIPQLHFPFARYRRLPLSMQETLR
jgi:hypothetical protein